MTSVDLMTTATSSPSARFRRSREASVIAAETRVFRLGEFHSFSARNRRFLYLVPAGAIFELDGAAELLIDRLGQGEASEDQLVADLTAHGFPVADAQELIAELHQTRVIVSGNFAPEPLQEAPADFPLQTLVLNLTNQCNLSCQYCYEFGEDKVATPEGKPKFMDYETAQASVDFLLEQSAGRRTVHITFFGGETLMNFPLLKKVVTYAHDRAAGQGRSIDFSLTTNATLLTPAIIEFLSENRIGVTVSMDGPPELHDKLRDALERAEIWSEELAAASVFSTTSVVSDEVGATLAHLRTRAASTLINVAMFGTFSSGKSFLVSGLQGHLEVVEVPSDGFVAEKFIGLLPSSPEPTSSCPAQVVPVAEGSGFDTSGAGFLRVLFTDSP